MVVRLGLVQTEPMLRIGERKLPAGREIGKTAENRTHEGALVFRRIVVGDGLYTTATSRPRLVNWTGR